MKRVSHKVAKVLKEAGYPQEVKEDERSYSEYDSESKTFMLIPYVMEVWLWLWREKKLYIDIDFCIDTEETVSYIHYDGIDFVKDDPEEVIIAAIEHLADNNFIE